MNFIQYCRVVLVCPSHPGNIGAAARAIKTMGLNRLYLVAPERYPHPVAIERASGAVDILEGAKIFATLQEAIADCHWVAGLTSRPRRIAWPCWDVRSAASVATNHLSQCHEVALVFGRELSGLSNEELDLCQGGILIPANPEYSSLNLAAAVQVMSYEMRMAQQEEALKLPTSAEPEAKPATHQELEYFYNHLTQTLVKTEFLDPNNPRHLMRRLRRLFHRAQINQMEVSMLRGILTSIDKCYARLYVKS